MKVKMLLKVAGQAINKYAPEILLGTSVVSFIAATVFAVDGTIKAVEIVKEETEKKGDELTKKETIAALWTKYVPTAIATTVGIGGIILSHHITAKRILALTSALALSQDKIKALKQKTEELLGEKQLKKIEDSIAQDEVSKMKVSENGPAIYDTDCMIVVDSLTGQQKRTTVHKIRSGLNEFNAYLIAESRATANDLLEFIGFDKSAMFEGMGWLSDDAPVSIRFSSAVVDDLPCLYINYDTMPAKMVW